MFKIAGLTVENVPPLPQYSLYMVDGKEGVGKTSLSASTGEGTKVLILDFESKGTSSLSNPEFPSYKDATQRENISVIHFPKDGAGAILDCTRLIAAVEGVFDHLIKTNNGDGFTLVSIDSITELQQRFMSLHPASDRRQAYGAWTDAIYGLIHKMRAAPVDKVLLSRPTVKEDDVTGKDIIRPSVSPAAWTRIAGLIDAIGYLTKTVSPGGKVTRVLDFSDSARYASKSRLNLGSFENPSFKEVLDAVRQPAPLSTQEAAPTATKPNRPSFKPNGK